MNTHKPYAPIAALFKLLVFIGLLAHYSAASAVSEIWQDHDPENSAVIDHSAWQAVLDQYLLADTASGVNLVDYKALAENGMDLLGDYIDYLADIEIDQYNREQQFAYWVNLYNALTVQLVAENYPVDSIKDISNSIIPLPFGPWKDDIITVMDETLTLDDIEHGILRPIWRDYRIHFAVNCASIGCPNLQEEAFTAINSEVLLEESAEAFINHPRAFSFDGNKLKLSSIFDWYRVDFGDSEKAMLKTISQYLDTQQRNKLADFDGRISYHYDWSLNSTHK